MQIIAASRTPPPPTKKLSIKLGSWERILSYYYYYWGQNERRLLVHNDFPHPEHGGGHMVPSSPQAPARPCPRLARFKPPAGSASPVRQKLCSDGVADVSLPPDLDLHDFFLFPCAPFRRINCPFCAPPCKLFSDKVTQIN